MSKDRRKTDKMAESLELELEVGDDSAAYKMSKAELDEYLSDEFCSLCDEMLDAFGACINPNCEANEDA